MTDAKTAAEPKPKQKGESGSLTALSVDPNQFIDLLAKELQAIPDVKPPAWAAFVKTGMHKERTPARKDWWHVRAAAVLRTVARLGPVGTSKLRTKFGGKQSRGYKSERFAPGSGSVIRKALQQLEKAGLIKQAAKGVHKGRIITKKASVMMESIALKVTKESKATTAKPAHATQTAAAHVVAAASPAVPHQTAAKEHVKVEA